MQYLVAGLWGRDTGRGLGDSREPIGVPGSGHLRSGLDFNADHQRVAQDVELYFALRRVGHNSTYREFSPPIL